MNSCNIFPSELSIVGYNCFRSNVSKSTRGVVIFVKNTISANLRKDLTDNEYLESVWVDIAIDSKNMFLLGGIYRSPNSSQDNTMKLFQLLNETCNEKYTHKIILGDFNFPDIDWNNWTTTVSENHVAFKFLECIRDNFLEQPITQPTRWRDIDPGNVLDLVFVDTLDFIKNVEITARLGNSDHLSIELEIDSYVDCKSTEIKKRNYYRGNYKLAADELCKIQWEVMTDMSVQDSWDFFIIR